jgi:hypothetical protein
LRPALISAIEPLEKATLTSAITASRRAVITNHGIGRAGRTLPAAA